MHRQHRLIGQGMGEIHFLGAKRTLLGKAEANRAFKPTANRHRNQKNGDDAKRQQAVSQCKGPHSSNVLNHAGLACAKNLGPWPKIFHWQRKIHPSEPGVSFFHDSAVLESEFKTDHATSFVSTPHTAAVRPESFCAIASYTLRPSAAVHQMAAPVAPFRPKPPVRLAPCASAKQASLRRSRSSARLRSVMSVEMSLARYGLLCSLRLSTPRS